MFQCGAFLTNAVQLYECSLIWSVIMHCIAFFLSAINQIILIIIITKTMFMVLSSWQSHCESLPGSFDECIEWRQAAADPCNTKLDDFCHQSACTCCQKLHPPSPCIYYYYSARKLIYRPTQGRRLSRPSWLVTYRDGLPVHRRSPILVLTGSDVAQLR